MNEGLKMFKRSPEELKVTLEGLDKEALINIILCVKEGQDKSTSEPTGTPAGHWRVEGLEDPHARYLDLERSQLAKGNLTDDELANAVFLHGDRKPSLEDMLAGNMPIAFLTGAKERIRWLSRQLMKATTAIDNAGFIIDKEGKLQINPQAYAEEVSDTEGHRFNGLDTITPTWLNQLQKFIEQRHTGVDSLDKKEVHVYDDADVANVMKDVQVIGGGLTRGEFLMQCAATPKSKGTKQ